MLEAVIDVHISSTWTWFPHQLLENENLGQNVTVDFCTLDYAITQSLKLDCSKKKCPGMHLSVVSKMVFDICVPVKMIVKEALSYLFTILSIWVAFTSLVS